MADVGVEHNPLWPFPDQQASRLDRARQIARCLVVPVSGDTADMMRELATECGEAWLVEEPEP